MIIELSLGHRCSAFPLFKIISPKIYQFSFFNGCFGDLSSHYYLLTRAQSNILSEVKLGVISGRYTHHRRILSRQDGDSVSFDAFHYVSPFVRQLVDYDIQPLLWQQQVWLYPGTSYGYLTDFTSSFSTWSNREILLTDSPHYFFTHCPAFDIAKGDLTLSPSDSLMLEEFQDSSIHLFYLSRLVSRFDIDTLLDELISDISNLPSQFGVITPFDVRYFLVIPYICSNSDELCSTYICEFTQTSDPCIFVSYLPFTSDMLRVGSVIHDIDFSDKTLQALVSQYMLQLKRSYRAYFSIE